MNCPECETKMEYKNRIVTAQWIKNGMLNFAALWQCPNCKHIEIEELENLRR
jgi:uncharacterized protein with PIN domain